MFISINFVVIYVYSTQFCGKIQPNCLRVCRSCTMALFVCPKCPWKERHHKYHRAEAGETKLRFANGNLWIFPNLILHFINDHSWLPPQEFINDVMYGTQVFSQGRARRQLVEKLPTLRRRLSWFRETCQTDWLSALKH